VLALAISYALVRMSGSKLNGDGGRADGSSP